MNTTDKPIFVFVYGTLLQGEANHRHMRDAQFYGHVRAISCDRRKELALFDLGQFPALVEIGDDSEHWRGANPGVQGELYLVTPKLLSQLDAFEGAPRLYQRKEVCIVTPYGTAAVTEFAFAYVMREGSKHLVDAPLIRSSSWRHRRASSLPPAVRSTP